MTTATQARCAECATVQDIPAVAECEHCGSSQLRRVDPLEDALRDVLAELDVLIAENSAQREIILRAITKLTFVLGEAYP